MCLYSKNRFPRIAWKPIKVYKVVKNKHSRFYTPYRDYEIKYKNVINISTTLLSIVSHEIESMYIDLHIITYGFFHSFLDKRKAKELITDIYGKPHDYTIIIATIPKLSLYYIGLDGEVCSNKLNTEFKKV